MNLFIADQVFENVAILTGEESVHCTKVLRKQKGDILRLTDGDGFFYEGTITAIDSRQCLVQISQKWEGMKHPYYLHIAIAPTKNISRLEWFVEKSVEIGIDEITPVIFEHSERKNVNYDRLVKIVRSAVKQSLHPSIPKINQQMRFRDVMLTSSDFIKIAAHLADDHPHLNKLMVQKDGKYLVLIGPEGDFAEKEIDLLKENNWRFAALGHYRLRTETAGVVAAQIASSCHW